MKRNKLFFNKKYKEACRFFNKYINGTRGAIALFLVVIMLPFASIAGVLINGARINSAVAIFDEALCNASNSTLGTYDTFLRKRFGLLAMSQDTSGKAAGYTAEDLLSDTFKFYMQQNLQSLSNTYISSDVDTMGVYPLADTDVLYSQILEYSKYTVPTKMIIDGLSLDDFISELTDNFDLLSKILDTASAKLDMDKAIDECKDSLTAAAEALKVFDISEETEDAEGNSLDQTHEEYIAAYEAFRASVISYNGTIDARALAVSSRETEVNNAETVVDTCTTELEALEESTRYIFNQIEEWENETDAEGNPIDNSEKIKTYKEEHKDEIDAYNTAVSDLATAKDELSAAESALSATISYYANVLAGQRSTISTNKTTYYNKIDSMAAAVQTAGEAVKDAQEKITAMIEAGVDLVKNVADTALEAGKESTESKKEELEANYDEAVAAGDTEKAEAIKEQMSTLDTTISVTENQQSATEAYIEAGKATVSTFDQFLEIKHTETFNKVRDALIELRDRVGAYAVPNTTIKASAITEEAYYVEVVSPISAEGIVALQENLASELANSTFLALVKAALAFIKAIFEIQTLYYDGRLCATVDEEYYRSSIGGLPSQRSKSVYAMDVAIQTEDAAKSKYYLDEIGKFSENPNGLGGGEVTLEDLIDELLTNIDSLSAAMNAEWKWNTLWENLKAVTSAIKNIAISIKDIFLKLIQNIASYAYEKSLLAGYIAYNTSNRTTYSGSALTGESYDLPMYKKDDHNTMYAFNGAETEYILLGSMDEIENQKYAFRMTYLVRILLNIPCIATDSFIAQIATEAGAVTFGIGTVVVYVAYIFAEPLVDTVLLVNGVSVPVLKKAYLTPKGIMELIKSVINLSGAIETELGVAAYKVAHPEMSDDEIKAVIKKEGDSKDTTIKDKFKKSLSWDYTKTLLLIMLFQNQETQLRRLADIIQMEGAYQNSSQKAIGHYEFDLGKSYTYLRSSGNFTSNEFMKISNSPWNSTKRVMYRGY